MPKQKETKEKRKQSDAGLAVPACLFIGLGLGWLWGNFLAWLFIGLGVGFAIFAILKMSGK